MQIIIPTYPPHFQKNIDLVKDFIYKIDSIKMIVCSENLNQFVK